MQLFKLQNPMLLGQENTQQIPNCAYDKCFALEYSAKQTFQSYWNTFYCAKFN